MGQLRAAVGAPAPVARGGLEEERAPPRPQRVGRFGRDADRRRDSRSERPDDILDMSDYGKTDKVIVDIITLDSEACAPCQYMVEAVQNVAPHFEGIVEWREHKIKRHESVQFMTSLMVKNIPTICIDGVITFVSRIPPKEELVAAIQLGVKEHHGAQEEAVVSGIIKEAYRRLGVP